MNEANQRRRTPSARSSAKTNLAAILGALCLPLIGLPAAAQIPAGMTPILHQNDTKGWHWSKTSHHGTTGLAEVKDGVLYLSQRPYGQGGLLFTDKSYKNFDLYLETDVPWGVNSGIFLRSTEGGSAYQIELTQVSDGPPTAGGSGALIGEEMIVPKSSPPMDMHSVWKDGWNSFRIRMTGDSPTVTLWVNGHQMWEVTEPRNTKLAGETDGKIGLQLHWGSTYQPEVAKANEGRGWKPGAKIAFRNIAIKELP